MNHLQSMCTRGNHISFVALIPNERIYWLWIFTSKSKSWWKLWLEETFEVLLCKHDNKNYAPVGFFFSFCLFGFFLFCSSAPQDKISFDYDIERIIDDWILMGFLVGNDFIPHLPHLHINHDALPLLYRTYMAILPELGGKNTKFNCWK